MNRGSWISKGFNDLNNGETAYGNNSSRIEPKRVHQWLMDGTEADQLFPNKKQAVQIPNNTSYLNILNSDISSWANPPSFQTPSGNFAHRLFNTESTKTFNFDDINNINEEKVVENLWDDTFGLSMSHSLEDPRSGLNYSGIRKVKVSQVKDLENTLSSSFSHSYAREDINRLSIAQAYNRGENNTISLGPMYTSMGNSLSHEEANFISMGQPNISTGHTHKRDETNNIETDLIFGLGQSYNTADENIISMNEFGKGGHDHNIMSMGQSFIDEKDANTLSTSINIDNHLSIGDFCNKGDGNTISFVGYDDTTNLGGKLMHNCDLLMGHQSSIQETELVNEKEPIESNGDALVDASKVSCKGVETISKKKVDVKISKKAPPNSFPSNVRSLLSTRVFDGVPVKYIEWSRMKELRGIIKGSGYMCGCQSCNFSKVVNAHEFEKHADCKTNHPNDHIHFENGMTIYSIVQELKSTPQNMLFEVIQTITGSPINQKSFRVWKESYLAATRELQRIYGNDEEKTP